MHLLICHDFHDWRGDDFLTLLVRLVSWEAFSCFPWFGMAGMTVSQNMMVAWWAKDCEDALRVYDLSACQGPTALNMEGESRGVDKVDLDRRLWPHSLLYFFFFKAMLLSASFYTQAWNHAAHICQHPNAHKRHAHSLSPFYLLLWHRTTGTWDILWWKIPGPGFLD